MTAIHSRAFPPAQQPVSFQVSRPRHVNLSPGPHRMNAARATSGHLHRPGQRSGPIDAWRSCRIIRIDTYPVFTTTFHAGVVRRSIWSRNGWLECGKNTLWCPTQTNRLRCKRQNTFIIRRVRPCVAPMARRAISRPALWCGHRRSTNSRISTEGRSVRSLGSARDRRILRRDEAAKCFARSRA